MRHIYTVLMMALGLSVCVPAQAAQSNTDTVQNVHHVQFLGKRAYQPPVVAKADAEQSWVGATLRVDQVNQLDVLKIHTLGKRAY